MSWFMLAAAGVLEIVWAIAMKQSLGFSRLTPSLITVSAMLASFWLLSAAMRTIPLGTAYPIWTGVGALGAFIVGVIFLGETVNMTKLAAGLFIVLGLILIKLSNS